MTRVLLSAILVPLALGASVIQTKKMDAFSGSWSRDEVVQQNGRPLPRVSWQVDFDQTTMTLTERTEAGTVSRTVRYNLDGSETQESKPEMTHRLKWDAAKQVIILSETMVGSENPPMMGMSINEYY